MNLEDKSISRYLTNLNKDIYCIKELPEEVIAVLFAYVSRSDKGIRENIKKVTEDKARKFHDKWVIGYGHSSVGELAIVHVGIERVSRLFSSLIERSSPYISFIEYSQRYQKPKINHFHIPKEIDKNLELKKEYIEFQNHQYHDYEYLVKKLTYHYDGLEKKAFEDARYLLPLATYTSLGLTSNARAMTDCINYLLSSDYDELRTRGYEIKNEVRNELPTLTKRAGDNNILEQRRLVDGHYIGQEFPCESKETSSDVNLLDFTGMGSNNHESKALEILIADLYYKYQKNNWIDFKIKVKDIEIKEKKKILDRFFSKFTKHDNLPEAFENIRYKFELNISEGCWHQMLRHRRLQFIWSNPNIDNGYIIPNSIDKSKELDVYKRGIERSQSIYNKINRHSIQASHYVITNAHKRRVLVGFSLKDLYYLIFLRTRKNVQWDIKSIILSIKNHVKKIHPYLMSKKFDL